MKNLLFLITFLAVTTLSAQDNVSVASTGAIFDWDKTEHNFGKIEKDEKVTVEFTFTNSGTEPLIILQAKGSCGCTVAEYTKSPIEPGEEGRVLATYNAAKEGAFTKTITVTANNSEGPQKLLVKGTVVTVE